ncbi:N-acetylmuramoyl-L-alanine amidase [Cytobacillus eiseniae]|uniref:N-acetylmuramoyl-L-alanine amidase n=1 Tax=Cytobacillus eiseniae TaxID=762947 RepID=A0ABS4RI81_9BACI|nr:N-acetylmuramoyl-L-alanine amidase [Cytobacillus eiseniae]MBP2242617.1 N-acetylmuramoyl-L-alanine amidase [Cytobacillus eiseniae]
MLNKRTRLIIFSVLVLLIVISLVEFRGTSTFDSNKNNMQSDNKEYINNQKITDKKYKIVIDPGHGGKDVGSTGVSGQYEKDFTLSVSKKVENLLKQESQIDVYMTRADDSFLSQESRYRPKYANELNADLLISIHGNTFDDSSVSGTEVFYYHKNSRKLAEVLLKHVVEATGFRDRGAKKQDLFVVKDTEMPAVLIEVGYLTNPQDESKMWTAEGQNDVAAAIVEGIKEYIYGNF